MKIEQSERFINEYNDFKNKINQISDDRQRNELLGLLKQLLENVRKLDQQHQQLLVERRLPSTSENIKHDIVNIRKSIYKRLEKIN